MHSNSQIVPNTETIRAWPFGLERTQSEAWYAPGVRLQNTLSYRDDRIFSQTLARFFKIYGTKFH